MKTTPRHVALGIPFCHATHRVLLVTSRKHPSYWIFPKGGVDKGETTGEAAAREAVEEAGIRPPLSISAELSVHEPHAPPGKRPEIWHTHALEMRSESDLDDEWLEGDERQRKWFTPHEVVKKLEKWGVMSGEDDGVEGGEGEMARGGKKKKAVKGDAMMRSFKAFAEEYGWEK